MRNYFLAEISKILTMKTCLNLNTTLYLAEATMNQFYDILCGAAPSKLSFFCRFFMDISSNFQQHYKIQTVFFGAKVLLGEASVQVVTKQTHPRFRQKIG